MDEPRKAGLAGHGTASKGLRNQITDFKCGDLVATTGIAVLAGTVRTLGARALGVSPHAGTETTTELVFRTTLHTNFAFPTDNRPAISSSALHNLRPESTRNWAPTAGTICYNAILTVGAEITTGPNEPINILALDANANI